MTESRPARGVLPEHNRFLFQKLLIRSFVLPVIASVLLGASFVGMTVYLRSLSYWVDHTDVVIGEASRAELEMSGIQSSLANFLIFKGSVFLDQAKDKEEGMAKRSHPWRNWYQIISPRWICWSRLLQTIADGVTPFTLRFRLNMGLALPRRH